MTANERLQEAIAFVLCMLRDDNPPSSAAIYAYHKLEGAADYDFDTVSAAEKRGRAEYAEFKALHPKRIAERK